ncbi:MAG: hypothetical protein IT539_03075 [Bradyrhizobiaceae bacterium]|nr:hypothetical protein [Bradyrhizobiaceae bacterium]
MKKFGLVLAAVSALALGSLVSAQPARADAGATIAIVGGLGWGYCHITYGQPRQTPLCAWHDYWHAQWHPAPAPAPKKK